MRIPRVENRLENRPCQGDIYRNLEYFEWYKEVEGNIEISTITFPLAVVLTQDCDLEQHASLNRPQKNQDKLLISVLVAPMYNSELLVEGEHLRDLDRKSERIGGALQKSLKSNQRLRYHALEFPLIAALPDVVIDFKHYFSQTVDYLQLMRTSHYVGSLPDLFREDLAQRFSSFLSRVDLPEVAMAEPPETREGGPQGGSGEEVSSR